jgi:hypothetical protein
MLILNRAVLCGRAAYFFIKNYLNLLDIKRFQYLLLKLIVVK